MQLALISNIHGNLEALEAVLDDLEVRGPGAMIACAGDVVGYGPDPWACLDLLSSRGAMVVKGNHEEMVLGLRGLSECGYAAVVSAIWTRKLLSAALRVELEALPLWAMASPGVVVCHGGLETTQAHVSTPNEAREALCRLEAASSGARTLVCGNSHRAAFYSTGESFRLMVPGEAVTLRPREHHLVNPGAVGQARGGRPLASYALLDLDCERLSFFAIAYDHETTLSKLRSAGLVSQVVMNRPAGIERHLERVKATLTRRWSEWELRNHTAQTPSSRRRPAVTFYRSGLRRRTNREAQRALHCVGADEACVWARLPRGAQIITYHCISRRWDEPWLDPRFATPDWLFARQMEFLSRRRHVLSLDEVLEGLDRGESPTPGSVVITFDDGYRSTLETAMPILKHYGFPAVLYLSTGYITRAQSQFVDVLYGTFNLRTRNRLHLAELGHDPVWLDNPKAVQQCYYTLQAQLTAACRTERDRILGEVAGQLRPERAGPRLTLTWDEVHRLRKQHDAFEVGVHTREHVDLRSSTPDVALLEVLGSIADVRQEQGGEPRHFSFPFGRTSHIARAVVRDSGLRSAVTAGHLGLVSTGVDHFALPRIDVPPDLSLFGFYTSGASTILTLKAMRSAR
jgi:peptidoglycan/xylan/chitin deacetylase (PgdA/CDA1 family)/predicted phosphodiesterase